MAWPALFPRAAPLLVKAEIIVVSIVIYLPPHKGRPFAMTSILLLSEIGTVTLRSLRNWFSLTLAPASLHILAIHTSADAPRNFNTPVREHAER